jgi:UDP-2,4-diacetamido-2,4,6-trideoxy-beta-L-altropyranose hydrolase
MNILIRCDATRETGLGHLSRCLGLAEALRLDGTTCRFVGDVSATACGMLAAADFAIHGLQAEAGSAADADALATLALSLSAGVVVDSYAIDAAWVGRLASHGIAPVLIDDFARLSDYSGCAGVLNFTIGADAHAYRGVDPSRVACGPRVLLVRAAVAALRGATMIGPTSVPPTRILITLGGGDVRGLTLPLWRAVRAVLPSSSVRALHPNAQALAADAGVDSADFLPPASDLAEHYAWADYCIAGGGLTKYECAYLGLPVGIVSQTADQQRETDVFCARGLATDLAAPGDARSWNERLDAFLHDLDVPRRARSARAHFPADAPRDAAAFVRAVLANPPVTVPIGVSA